MSSMCSSESIGSAEIGWTSRCDEAEKLRRKRRRHKLRTSPSSVVPWKLKGSSEVVSSRRFKRRLKGLKLFSAEDWRAEAESILANLSLRGPDPLQELERRDQTALYPLHLTSVLESSVENNPESQVCICGADIARWPKRPPRERRCRERRSPTHTRCAVPLLLLKHLKQSCATRH